MGERQAIWGIGYWERQNLLPLRKQDNKFYKQVHSQVLQDVVLRLDKAYQAFFKKLLRYPKFRTGKYNSFTYPQWGGWKIFDNKLVLSHIGAIKFKMHRIPVGTAARNILKLGLEQVHAEQKPLLVRRISKFQSMKQEAHVFRRGRFTNLFNCTIADLAMRHHFAQS